MKPKVLLVDDEKLNLLTFEAFLSGDGYELLFAENGRQAIEMARRQTPDLILLDVMMPEMNGYEVCRRIRQDPAIDRVPIVIVTALHDTTSRLEGLKAGADDFVTKPCSRDEMRARVRTIISLNRFRTIADQRARFERLHDLAPIGIVVVDENGTIATANQRAESLLAVASARELAQDSVFGRFEPSDSAAVGAVIQAALVDIAVALRDVRRNGPAGEQVLRLRGTAIPEDRTRRVMLLISDVTEEVHAREALEKVNRELDEMVRARTKQLEDANELLLSYASFVSHDLRSPLAAIKGYLSMIHEEAVPIATAKPLVDRAYSATVMMQELIQNILQLARDVHEGSAARGADETNPRPVIEHVWSHVTSLFPHENRRFKLGELPPVNASRLMIERVFYNLLANAAKYSAQRAAALIEIGALETPGGPAIFVRDNGIGFDARDADKLFREFSRLADAPPGEGFGLGLSLVARLVRAHGGEIWAEGESGNGATFYVRFGGAPSEHPPLVIAAAS